MRIQVFTPADYIGPVMELITRRRGVYQTTEYQDSQRVQFKVPIQAAMGGRIVARETVGALREVGRGLG
jgi:translation elongation factor EF-4